MPIRIAVDNDEVVVALVVEVVCAYAGGRVGHQCEQLACMSFVMPGHVSAFDIMFDVPWWAACKADRHDGLKEGSLS